MKSGLKVLISFVAGAVTGGAAVWFYSRERENKAVEEVKDVYKENYIHKKKYEELENFVKTAPIQDDMIDSEIPKSILRLLGKGDAPEDEQEDKDPKSVAAQGKKKVDAMLESAKKIAEEHKYTSYADVEEKQEVDEKKDETTVEEKIGPLEDNYIDLITASDFGEQGFEACGITMYRDGVFTDDAEQVMSESYISDTIGFEVRDKILALDEDADTVYVRNTKTRKDYEIVTDIRTYKQAQKDRNEG